MAVPSVIGAQQPATRPVYHAVVTDRRSPDEQTLVARIAHLDAALVIKVVGEPRGMAVAVRDELLGPFANRPGVDPPPFVHTETPVEIMEVFKGSPAARVAGTRLVLVTSGGNAPWKDGRAIGTWPFAKKILNRPWRDALAAFRTAAVDAESLN